MVRCLRGPSARDPRLRRQLVRDVRALRPMVQGIRFDEADAAIMAPLPGPVFQESPPGGQVSVDALARLVVGTVHHLQAWENAGLGVDDLDAAELRDASDHLVVVCLTPQPVGTGTSHWQHITHLVDAWWATHAEHPLADLVRGWRTFPPHSAAEAADACMAAMGEELARMRHTIVRTAEITRTSSRRERLDDLVARLDVCVPPPAGKAAVGVDLDGQSLQVLSDGSSVSWGPIGGATTVLYDEEDGFDVPAARRLVRMRGAGPISARDNAAIGGSPAFADAITRWLGASLELRTIHLLLQATADAGTPEAW